MTKGRAPLPFESDEFSSEAGVDEPVRHLRPSGFHRSDTFPTDDATRPAPEEPVRPGWTVIEQYVRDGFLYQIRRKPLTGPNGAVRLTKREEEVLSLLLDGNSNKSIAYSLGLSPSTVGVLVFRAAAKLGAKSRRELLLAYERLKRREE